MAGKALNAKICTPLKLRGGLAVKKPAICVYSYNLPLLQAIRTFQNLQKP